MLPQSGGQSSFVPIFIPVMSPMNPPTMVWNAGVIASKIFELSTEELKSPIRRAPTMDKRMIVNVHVAIKVTYALSCSFFILKNRIVYSMLARMFLFRLLGQLP